MADIIFDLDPIPLDGLTPIVASAPGGTCGDNACGCPAGPDNGTCGWSNCGCPK